MASRAFFWHSKCWAKQPYNFGSAGLEFGFCWAPSIKSIDSLDHCPAPGSLKTFFEASYFSSNCAGINSGTSSTLSPPLSFVSTKKFSFYNLSNFPLWNLIPSWNMGTRIFSTICADCELAAWYLNFFAWSRSCT